MGGGLNAVLQPMGENAMGPTRPDHHGQSGHGREELLTANRASLTEQAVSPLQKVLIHDDENEATEKDTEQDAAPSGDMD